MKRNPKPVPSVFEEMQRFMVEVDPGIKLNLIRHGRNPVSFFMVHGLASNARLYDGVALELEKKGYSSIALDQRGHGDSSKPAGIYTHDLFCSDLARIAEASSELGAISRPVWVGQSWGASVVSEFASRFPQHVGALVLVDGGLIDLKWIFENWESCSAFLTPPNLSGVTMAQVEAWIRNEHPAWSDTAVASTLANLELNDEGGISAKLSRTHHMEILHELYNYDPLATLAKVAVPIRFLIAGKQNSLFANYRERAIDTIGKVCNVTFEIFDDGDHDLHAQNPHRVAEIAQELLLTSTRGDL